MEILMVGCFVTVVLESFKEQKKKIVANKNEMHTSGVKITDI